MRCGRPEGRETDRVSFNMGRAYAARRVECLFYDRGFGWLLFFCCFWRKCGIAGLSPAVLSACGQRRGRRAFADGLGVGYDPMAAVRFSFGVFSLWRGGIAAADGCSGLYAFLCRSYFRPAAGAAWIGSSAGGVWADGFDRDPRFICGLPGCVPAVSEPFVRLTGSGCGVARPAEITGAMSGSAGFGSSTAADGDAGVVDGGVRPPFCPLREE